MQEVLLLLDVSTIRQREMVKIRAKQLSMQCQNKNKSNKMNACIVCALCSNVKTFWSRSSLVGWWCWCQNARGVHTVRCLSFNAETAPNFHLTSRTNLVCLDVVGHYSFFCNVQRYCVRRVTWREDGEWSTHYELRHKNNNESCANNKSLPIFARHCMLFCAFSSALFCLAKSFAQLFVISSPFPRQIMYQSFPSLFFARTATKIQIVVSINFNSDKFACFPIPVLFRTKRTACVDCGYFLPH